jgi:predicted RNA binding protein YcfA (HicA-like mRNA interferase family)
LSGADLVKALGRFGYSDTRQTGSHIRLTLDAPTQHHVTIPAHEPLKLGTLAAIHGDVAAHPEISRDVLLDRLFG